MTALVVIPTYNEIGDLARLTDCLLADSGLSLLIVDDNSPDGTGALADRLAAQNPGRFQVLHRPGKQGLGSAYVDGFRIARRGNYDFVVQMDADFSHDPDDVPRLIAAARTADVAIGSRYVKGGSADNWPAVRWLVSRGGSFYTQVILGLGVKDPTSGFKCFRREALARLDLDQIRARGFGFQVEVNWCCHLQRMRVVEVPIRFVDRKLGTSKMSRKIFSWRRCCWSGRCVWKVLGIQKAPSCPPRSALMQAIRDLFRLRVVRFGLVGLVGVGVNLAIVRLLFGQLHWAAPVASGIGTEISIIGNFIGNNRWTFGERTISPVRFARYNLAALGAIAITAGAFTLITQHTNAPYLLADLVGIGLGTGWNFATSVLWTWAH